MASEIVLPQWGMEMQDGTIVRWLKQEGDTVAEGEPIVEVETAKLQTELESTASGILSRIVAQEGEIVPIRGVLCVIAEPGEEIAPPAAPASTSPEPATQVAPASNGAGVLGVQVVPAARRLARERGVDLAQVRGSGPNGRILLADVEAAPASPCCSRCRKLSASRGTSAGSPSRSPTGPGKRYRSGYRHRQRAAGQNSHRGRGSSHRRPVCACLRHSVRTVGGRRCPPDRHSRRGGYADVAEHPDHGAGYADHRGHRD